MNIILRDFLNRQKNHYIKYETKLSKASKIFCWKLQKIRSVFIFCLVYSWDNAVTFPGTMLWPFLPSQWKIHIDQVYCLDD